jgi:hypothetical protein
MNSDFDRDYGVAVARWSPYAGVMILNDWISFAGAGPQRGCWRALVLVLVLLQVYPLAAQQGSSVPLSPASQEIKRQVSRIAIDGKLTVRKMDGTEYHGRLQSIEAESFSMHEVDLKQTVTLAYAEVDRVSKNYGGKGVGGKRVNPKRSLIVGAVTVGAVFVILIVLLAAEKS